MTAHGNERPLAQPGREPLEIDSQPDVGRDGGEDVVEGRRVEVTDQAAALPVDGERSDHLGVAYLEPASEEVDVELERVGHCGGRPHRTGDVGGSVGDDLHARERDGFRWPAPVGWAHHVGIGTASIRTDLERATPRGTSAAREVGTVLAAACVYFGARLVVQGDTAEATSNADRILAIERWFGIDVERCTGLDRAGTAAGERKPVG